MTANDIGDDLQITKTTQRTSVGGTWVSGAIAGYQFNCLVFSEHAECTEYELGDSRISKLCIVRLDDKSTAADFDRGWNREPKDAATWAVVDFLAAGLADCIFHANR